MNGKGTYEISLDTSHGVLVDVNSGEVPVDGDSGLEGRKEGLGGLLCELEKKETRQRSVLIFSIVR